MLYKIKLTEFYDFFFIIKMIENNFPIKKITIPKVGDSKPTLNPPAKTC